jgi:hypothetical protein
VQNPSEPLPSTVAITRIDDGRERDSDTDSDSD